MGGSLFTARGNWSQAIFLLVPQFPLLKSGDNNSLHLSGLLRIKCNNVHSCLARDLVGGGVLNFSYSLIINFSYKLYIKMGKIWRESSS